MKLTEAADLFERAYNRYDTLNTSTWPEAKKILKDAVKTYDEAISVKYDVYDKYTQKFLKGLSGYYYDELGRAKYYENKASNYFREARINKKKVEISDGFYEEFVEFHAAFHNLSRRRRARDGRADARRFGRRRCGSGLPAPWSAPG